MNSKTIIASLGLLSLACTAQAAQSPWGYYNPQPYSPRYDSTFGASIKGVYAWATNEIDPDMYGYQLGLHANIETGSIFHELSLNTGLLHGSQTYLGMFTDGSIGSLKLSVDVIPLMFGYTFNAPISEVATFYIGGKMGASVIEGKLSISEGSIKTSEAFFSFSGLIGFKFAIGEKTDIVIGYELYKVENADPFHAITMGVSWMF